MLKAANKDVRYTSLLQGGDNKVAGGSRKRQGYRELQYTILSDIIEKNTGYVSKGKMILLQLPLQASVGATQRVDNWVEFSKIEYLFTVSFDIDVLTPTLFWALLQAHGTYVAKILSHMEHIFQWGKRENSEQIISAAKIARMSRAKDRNIKFYEDKIKKCILTLNHLNN